MVYNTFATFILLKFGFCFVRLNPKYVHLASFESGLLFLA